MKIPPPKNTIQSKIDAAHKAKESGGRYHLGVSELGEKCRRKLWLSFRWAVQEDFPGRILRLFRRGQLEEEMVIEDLRMIGVDVKQVERQDRVRFGAHVSGSMDGTILGGLPGAEKTKHILEIKTMSKKKWDELDKMGLEKANFRYWVQCHVYMLGSGIDRALFYSVCKDDDRVYTERVKLNKELAQKYVERGRSIALADDMPPPISTNPGWFECRFCPAHMNCHGRDKVEKKNCRTCAHSTAKEDSTWFCEKWQNEIPNLAQVEGCKEWELHYHMGEF